jgi:hypothetical protein
MQERSPKRKYSNQELPQHSAIYLIMLNLRLSMVYKDTENLKIENKDNVSTAIPKKY